LLDVKNVDASDNISVMKACKIYALVKPTTLGLNFGGDSLVSYNIARPLSRALQT
jgi:hypothetical protein